MMVAMMLPKALSAMRTFSARVEFLAPNTDEKKSEAASWLDVFNEALGTARMSMDSEFGL